MNTQSTGVFGRCCMLAATLAAFAALAQEPTDTAADELEPAVDTSLMAEPAVETSASVAEEPATQQPEAAAALLAADVSRREANGQVMDRLELGRTEITGNQELPKVLYIVPWKKSDPGDLMGRPVNTLLDEVLAPVDREEFVRQVDYYDDLYGEDGE